jgi:indole-3-glycerol phosphate synthase
MLSFALIAAAAGVLRTEQEEGPPLLPELVDLLLPPAAPLQVQAAARVVQPARAPAVRLVSAPVPGRPPDAVSLLVCEGSTRTGTPVMKKADLSEEPDGTKTDVAEWWDSAKDETEEGYLKKVEEEAAKARSPEALAAERERGAAAAAALRSTLDAEPEGPLAKALAAKGKKKPSDKVMKSLKKPQGTLALIGEGVPVDSISLGGYDLDDPEYLSREFRTGGCAVVSVRVACEKSLKEDALGKTVAEQESVRGEFPGPLPTIVRGAIVEEIQLADAKASGAAAVVLPLAVNGLERTGELMAEAELLGLEVLLRVCTEEQLGAAVGLEPKMVVIGDCNLEQAKELREKLPEGTVSVADVPTNDVRGAWQVRDAGFNSLISGEDLLKVCIRDRAPPQAVIKAILSKGSVKFGLGFQKGRLEGAKEILGSIAM